MDIDIPGIIFFFTAMFISLCLYIGIRHINKNAKRKSRSAQSYISQSLAIPSNTATLRKQPIYQTKFRFFSSFHRTAMLKSIHNLPTNSNFSLSVKRWLEKGENLMQRNN